MTREFLNPRRKLVDEVVDWLLARIETDASGARTLAHVMAIVPTAQAGRTLRLQLARAVSARFDGAGVLPPQVVLPMGVIAPQDESLQTATPVQLRAAFLKFVATRPKRHLEGGRIVLDEWDSLFSAAYVTDVRSHLSFLDQLSDIWRILAGGGCLMADVAESPAAREVLQQAAGEDERRWLELGSFERAFFDFLHGLGLRHQAEAIKLAKTQAKALPPEVREVVLPALADPVAVVYDVLRQQRDGVKVTVLLHAAADEADRFDEWGRPTVAGWTGRRAPVLDAIRNEDVVRAGTDTELVKLVAADFPPADGDLAVPALGLCDEALFPELSAAFLNAGYELHNPELHLLASSSLGRLAETLVDVYAARKTGFPWESFSTLLHLDDVLQALLDARSGEADGVRLRRRDVLCGLDIVRNTFLPQVVPTDFAFDESRLKTHEKDAFAAVRTVGQRLLATVGEVLLSARDVADFVREMCARLYARRDLSGREREFVAALQLLRDVLGQFGDERLESLALNEGARIGLLRKTLAEAAYSLEPEAANVLRTEGWLELVWSAADKIALVGFNEGAVPDPVVGHAFLPDSLRRALSLTTNDQRLARDAYLLSDLLAARSAEKGAVRAYFAQANAAGDIHRPSRLLFLVPDEALAVRVRALFGELPPGLPLPGRTLSAAWRPRLPDAVPVPKTSKEFPEGRLSASAIDTWLKCPFSYLLKYGLGMDRVKEKTELEANDFGTVVHLALELYAREQLARTAAGLGQLHAEEDIARSLTSILATVRKGFGGNSSVSLRLQLDAAEERLKCFARIQAQWAEEGWQVAESPEFGFTARPFAGETLCDVPVKGMIDRIDWKDGVGYRLIDYKTWDRKSGAEGRLLKGGAEQLEHARRLGLPVVGAESGKGRRFLTVQLPLYGRCLERFDPPKFAGRIADYCYLLLGETPDDTVVLGSAFDQGAFEARRTKKARLSDLVNDALNTARVAIRRIRENVFWPAGPSEEWRWDLKDVLSVSPERDFPVGTAWRDAQEAKLAQIAEREGLA